jgi:t-SNARE complex subunit (syntaxin)
MHHPEGERNLSMRLNLRVITQALSIALVLVIGATLNSHAEEIDALDKAYKEQHDMYISETADLQTSMDKDREYLDKLDGIVARFEKIPGTYPDVKRIRDDQMGVAKRLQEKQNRLKKLQEKKQELKITILEKQGALPSWWVN